MSTESASTANAWCEGNSPEAETSGNLVGTLSSEEEEIRRHAYEIYLERGDQPRTALDDWLQAEREVQERVQLARNEHGMRANR